MKRKESEEKRIYVELKTDTGTVKYENERWNSELEVKTFNERYIDEYVMMSEKFQSDALEITLSKEAANSSIFSGKVKIIEDCLNNYNSIEFRPNGNVLSYTGIEKLLKKIPRTSSKLIAKHMEDYMKKNNLTWLLAGYYNQRNINECPYCGQPIQSDYAKKITKEIERFTMMKGMESAKEIKGNIERIISHLNREKIEEAIAKYNGIIETLASNDILTATKKSQYIIDSDIC